MTPEEKTPIARYACDTDEFCSFSYMSASPLGQWCKWDDVSPLIDRIAALEGAIRLHEESHLRYGDHARRYDKKLWALLPD